MPLFDESLFGGGEPTTSHVTEPAGYLGRFQLGDVVTMSVATVDGTGVSVTPDAAPVATVRDASASVVATVKLAMAGVTTAFSLGIPLGRSFSLGTYSVAYSYTFGGNTGSASNSFDVIPGGDPGGRVISIYGYDRPEARYVVAQLSSGNIVQGRNPHL